MVALSTIVERLLLLLLTSGRIIFSDCLRFPSILKSGAKRGFGCIKTYERRGTILKGSSYSVDTIVEKRKRLKVLCLHGYLSSSKYFSLQLRRLVDEGASTTDFVFLDGPHKFGLKKPSEKVEKDAFASVEQGTVDEVKTKKTAASGKFRWWYASESRLGLEGFDEAVQYLGLKDSLIAVANAEKEEGPFDIVLGHSQGGCLVVAMDCLKSRPDFLATLLNDDSVDFDVTPVPLEFDFPPLEKADRKLPSSSLSIVLGGFVPRDQLFDTLFASIEKDTSMKGLPQNSVHIFSHEDKTVPAEASMQAMNLYENPKMSITSSDHDPDDETVDKILKAIDNLWIKKYRAPLVLED